MDFPVNALPTLLRQTIKAQCQVGNYPIEAVATAVLAIMSHSVQGLYNVKDPDPRRMDKTYPLSQYFLVIAEFADAKSTVYESVKRGIDDWQKAQWGGYTDALDQYNVELEDWNRQKRSEDKEIDRVALEHGKPKPPRSPDNILHSPTSKAIIKALAYGWQTQALFSSEAGSFLGGYAMTKDERTQTAATLTSLWDNGNFKKETGDELIPVRNRRLSSLLMVQSEVVKSFINDPLLRNQGIHARFHLVRSPTWDEQADDYTDPSVIEASRSIKMNLDSFNNRVRELLSRQLPLDEEDSLDLPLIEWSEDGQIAGVGIRRQCVNLKKGSDKTYNFRLWEHSIRMAGVLTAFTSDTPQITPDIIQSAFEIVKFYSHHWTTLDVGASSTPQDERAEEFERKIKASLSASPEGMTLAKIIKSRFKSQHRPEVSKSLENLVAIGDVVAEERVHPTNGAEMVVFRLAEAPPVPATPAIEPPPESVSPEPPESPSEAPCEPVAADALDGWLAALDAKPAVSDSPDVATRAPTAVERPTQDHAAPNLSALIDKVQRTRRLNVN